MWINLYSFYETVYLFIIDTDIEQQLPIDLNSIVNLCLWM